MPRTTQFRVDRTPAGVPRSGSAISPSSTIGEKAVNAKKRRLVLAIVATDRTFERVELRDGEAYVGKCIHCNAKVVVDLDGEPVGVATIEHIEPRSRGGTDAIENL